MNTDWLAFLTTQGAVQDEHGEIFFPKTREFSFDPTLTYLCDLSNMGLIRARGEDAANFLHGQFTNDLNLVSTETSQLSAYCNAKGRMLAIFRIFKRGDDFFLLLNKDVIEIVLQKLNMFKLMAKVELADVSNEFVVFGVAGPNTEALLTSFDIETMLEPEQVVSQQNITVLSIPSDNSRIVLISSPEDVINIWQSFINQSTPSSSHTWELIDIQNGIPHVVTETIEAFIPQMVNLELIGGVNFQKGCYPGQEIVARTHYLGKPNRRMYRITFEADTCPIPGDNIFSQADGEQPVGKIVSAQNTNKSKCEALAVLRTEKESSNDLHVQALSGPQANVTTLPYSLDAD